MKKREKAAKKVKIRKRGKSCLSTVTGLIVENTQIEELEEGIKENERKRKRRKKKRKTQIERDKYSKARKIYQKTRQTWLSFSDADLSAKQAVVNKLLLPDLEAIVNYSSDKGDVKPKVKKDYTTIVMDILSKNSFRFNKDLADDVYGRMKIAIRT